MWLICTGKDKSFSHCRQELFPFWTQPLKSLCLDRYLYLWGILPSQGPCFLVIIPKKFDQNGSEHSGIPILRSPCSMLSLHNNFILYQVLTTVLLSHWSRGMVFRDSGMPSSTMLLCLHCFLGIWLHCPWPEKIQPVCKCHLYWITSSWEFAAANFQLNLLLSEVAFKASTSFMNSSTSFNSCHLCEYFITVPLLQH